MSDSRIDAAPLVIPRFSGRFAYLSNFYQIDVAMPDGIVYPSAEHAFQAAKTDDMGVRRDIADAQSSHQAKTLGREVALVDGWNEGRRYTAMARVIWAKFLAGSELAERFVRETGNATLIEGNSWHDNTWGACSCGRCRYGHNLLGWMLMSHRAYLTRGSSDWMESEN